ncbi:ABA4-like family protein [Qipengyuania sp. SM2507]
MAWDAIFGAANMLALVMWVGLILLPRWPALLSAALYLGVGLLCLAYASLLIGIVSGGIDPVGGQSPSMDFTTIEGIRAIFASDGGVTVGWIHYLAFDLFVGLWIARDADAKRFSRLVQAPILLATFLAGPLGLLLWLAIREGRAKALGRWR